MRQKNNARFSARPLQVFFLTVTAELENRADNPVRIRGT
jgi:hypothetical protein